MKPIANKIVMSVIALAIGSAIAAPSNEPPAFLKQKGLTVLEKKPGPNGMTAWVVSDGKGGAPAVMFTPASGDVAFAGVIWDAKSGKVLSSGYISQANINANNAMAPKAAPGTAQQPPQAANGVHPAATQINGMRGFTEGPIRPADKTLHIIFDPRCPYCHKLYDALRPMVKNGTVSVKWLPVIVLGSDADRARSLETIAAGFNGNDGAKAMADIFAGKSLKGKPDSKLITDLIQNEQFLKASYKENPDLGQVGVPTAYFMTKDNQPVMRKAGDVTILNQILQELKK